MLAAAATPASPSACRREISRRTFSMIVGEHMGNPPFAQNTGKPTADNAVTLPAITS
jgi:hypothetical protein